MSKKKGKKKSRSEKLLEKAVLATAIIQLLEALVKLINSLLD